MELIYWFTITAFLTGAIFGLTDILSDAFLFMQYTVYVSEEIFQIVGILTGTWIGLGGVFQCGVAVFLNIKGEPDGPFKSLPVPIRVLVIVTSLILLSPVVLNIYGAYTVTKYGIIDMVTEKIPWVIANLKFAEIIFESGPQLATQWLLMIVVGLNPGGDGFVWEPIPLLSIVTSALTIISSLVVFIAKKRKPNFISHQHPIMSSLVPITLWILFSVICGTVGVLTSLGSSYGTSI